MKIKSLFIDFLRVMIVFAVVTMVGWSVAMAGNAEYDEDEYATCPLCEGTGAGVCFGCAGNGGFYVGYSYCACPMCQGTGLGACAGCSGTGVVRISNNSYNGGYHGGYGGGSNGGSSSSSGRTCAGCRGTGICTACKGEGGYWLETGRYTGKNTKQWENCTGCHRSGKCGVCYGKGKI